MSDQPGKIVSDILVQVNKIVGEVSEGAGMARAGFLIAAGLFEIAEQMRLSREHSRSLPPADLSKSSDVP